MFCECSGVFAGIAVLGRFLNWQLLGDVLWPLVKACWYLFLDLSSRVSTSLELTNGNNNSSTQVQFHIE